MALENHCVFENLPDIFYKIGLFICYLILKIYYKLQFLLSLAFTSFTLKIFIICLPQNCIKILFPYCLRWALSEGQLNHSKCCSFVYCHTLFYRPRSTSQLDYSKYQFEMQYRCPTFWCEWFVERGYFLSNKFIVKQNIALKVF